jgi:hypothetical protein
MLHNIEDNQSTGQDYPGMNFGDIPDSIFKYLGFHDSPTSFYTVNEKTGKFVLQGEEIEVDQLYGSLKGIESGVDEYGEFLNFIISCYYYDDNFAIKLYKDRYSTLSLLCSFESFLNNKQQTEFAGISILCSKYHLSWNTARFSCAVLGIYTKDTSLVQSSLCTAEMQKLFFNSSLAEKETKLTTIVERIQALLLEKEQQWKKRRQEFVEVKFESYEWQFDDDSFFANVFHNNVPHKPKPNETL